MLLTLIVFAACAVLIWTIIGMAILEETRAKLHGPITIPSFKDSLFWPVSLIRYLRIHKDWNQ